MNDHRRIVISCSQLHAGAIDRRRFVGAILLDIRCPDHFFSNPIALRRIFFKDVTDSRDHAFDLNTFALHRCCETLRAAAPFRMSPEVPVHPDLGVQLPVSRQCCAHRPLLSSIQRCQRKLYDVRSIRANSRAYYHTKGSRPVRDRWSLLRG